MFHLYVIENQSKRIYIGVTTNIKNRLSSHNKPNGVDWTQGKGPWVLIYQETFDTKSQALAREKYLKSLKAGQRLKKILGILQ